MPPKKPIPIKRERSRADLRAEALTRLKNRWNQDHEEGEFDPKVEPIITPLLKSADGGIQGILEALRAYDEDDARDFIELYDDLSATDQKYLTLEEISHAAGFGSLRLAEIAQSAMFLSGQMRTKLLLSAGMPRVVETMLKQAVKPKGYADREWALKSGGVLPVPKGAQIAIQNNVAPAEKDEEGVKQPAAWLDSGERLRAIHEAYDQRKLPAPPSPPIELGGRIDNMQANTVGILRERDDV